MSGATDCQLETRLKPAPKRKTLHFCGLTRSHVKFRAWDGTSVIAVLVASLGWFQAGPTPLRSLAPKVLSWVSNLL
jgi:hypothetical protein